MALEGESLQRAQVRNGEHAHPVVAQSLERQLECAARFAPRNEDTQHLRGSLAVLPMVVLQEIVWNIDST